MATGLIKKNSIIGIEVESTEGTYVAPQATTSYIQPLADGFGMQPAREVIERGTLNASPGRQTPRMGIKTVAGSLPCEFRASGTEGGAPDFDSLLKGALGATRNAASGTSSSGHTSTVINFTDASDYSVGDIVLVEESGAFELRPVTGTTATSITLGFALSNGAPSDAVDVSAFRTWYTSGTGHPSLSVSYYWGNEVRQAMLGGRVQTMSIDGYTAGGVASFNFGMQGLNFTETDGAAPHTPSYDSGLPPVILSACVYRDGTTMELNDFSVSLTNTWAEKRSTCNSNGITGLVLDSREITGSINPYKDNTSTDYFDDWVAGTEFSLFATAYIPSTTSGEITLGSVVAIWMPQCIATEFETTDLNGILIDQMSFRATRGTAGTSEEMYIGMV